jgi:hypothetical protein
MTWLEVLSWLALPVGLIGYYELRHWYDNR